jgi:cob(I)alamin adenosyltransferase
MTTDDDDVAHAQKMARKKLAHDRIVAGKTIEKGLLMVHTGIGKGKSTAAFGMAMRAVGHGMRVGIVQFVKGRWDSGERAVLERFPELVEVHIAGQGFTWETQDRQRDIDAAQAGWAIARRLIADPAVRLVVLDELNIVLRSDTLDLAEVLEVLRNRPADTHVVVTGRNAKDQLMELADLVTDMALVKHPFRAGVKAQPGIEF